MTKVRSFTDYLNKFEEQFGEKALNLLKIGGINYLIALYKSSIPISKCNVTDFAFFRQDYQKRLVYIGIYKHHNPVWIAGALVHEATHALRWKRVTANQILCNKETYLNFMVNEEYLAIRNQCIFWSFLQKKGIVTGITGILGDCFIHYNNKTLKEFVENGRLMNLYTYKQFYEKQYEELPNIIRKIPAKNLDWNHTNSVSDLEDFNYDLTYSY